MACRDRWMMNERLDGKKREMTKTNCSSVELELFLGEWYDSKWSMLCQIASWIKWFIKKHQKLPFEVRPQVDSRKPRSILGKKILIPQKKNSISQKSLKFRLIRAEFPAIFHVTASYSHNRPRAPSFDRVKALIESNNCEVIIFAQKKPQRSTIQGNLSSFIASTTTKKCFRFHFASTVDLDMWRPPCMDGIHQHLHLSHSLSRDMKV